MSVEPNPYGASPHAPPTMSASSVSANTRSFTIRRVDPLSVAKLFGVLYALLGLIGALLYNLVARMVGGITLDLES